RAGSARAARRPGPSLDERARIGDDVLPNRSMRFLLPLTLLLGVAPLASAHHSRAEYTEGAREIEGTLVRILWRNPHPGFTIETVEAGRTVTWEVEGWSSLYTFDRAGITRERFREGDTVR